VTAVGSAIALWLVMIALGDAAVFGGLLVPVYIVFFGTVFVSAVGRSRFLPRAQTIEFLLPIFVGLILVLASGWLGIRGAHILNDGVFHMRDNFVR
jgi:hypothetical protein